MAGVGYGQPYLEVQVKLAVLGLLCRVVPLTDVDLESVEAKGDDLKCLSRISIGCQTRISYLVVFQDREVSHPVLFHPAPVPLFQRTVLSGEMLVDTVP